MASRQVTVSPVRDVWILAWQYASGKKRAQHPHIFIAGGSELTFRNPEKWGPIAAVVEEVGSRGPATLMAVSLWSGAEAREL